MRSYVGLLIFWIDTTPATLHSQSLPLLPSAPLDLPQGLEGLIMSLICTEITLSQLHDLTV